MNFQIADLFALIPEIFLFVMIATVLMVDLFIRNNDRFVVYAPSQVTLLVTAWLVVATHEQGASFVLNLMFVDDAMGDILKLVACGATSVVLVYARDYIACREMYKGEFFALALFALLGMMVMISAANMLVLYLGLELLSLSLYALVALRRDDSVATEAAMKYFVLGAVASGLLLYGMSMVYGVTGTLNLTEISEALYKGVQDKTVMSFGLVFIVAGLGFKLGVVPFHMWAPDVYQGAPTAVTLFISSAPKLAAFAFAMRLLVQGMEDLVHDWQDMLAIMAILSIALGNITAIAQTNIKRMLAYSTIAHMGFVLLGILAGSNNGYSSSMFYVVVYVLTSLGGFGMVILLSRANFEADKLDDFRGLNQRSPWYAFLMLLLMFSMAGVPPTVGFYAKLSVIQAALDAGYTSLVIGAVLLSVVGAFYYLRIVKLMYFDPPQEEVPPILPQTDMKIILGANGLAVLLLGIAPQSLMALCAYAIQQSL